MSLLELMSVPCELLSRYPDPGQTDPYGNPVQTETRTPSLCEIQQVSATEDHGDAVESNTWRLFLPPDVPVRGWDAIELSGTGWRYEIEGDGWEVRNPRTGLVTHIEATVRRVE